MRVFIFKVLAVFIGIFISLILLEISLQISAFYLKKESYQNTLKIGPDLKSKFVILAIGESTTSAEVPISWGKPWPTILDEKIKKKFPLLNAEVINLGKISANTQQIAENLFENFSKFNPKIVISMMGVNDTGYLLSKRSDLKTINLYNHIKASLFENSTGLDKNKNCSKNANLENEIQKELSNLTADDWRNQILLIQQKFTDAYPTERNLVLRAIAKSAYTFGIRSLSNCNKDCKAQYRNFLNENFQNFDLIFKECPLDEQNLQIILYLSIQAEQFGQGAEYVASYIKLGGQLSTESLNRVSYIAEEDDALMRFLLNENYKIEKIQGYQTTQSNYLKIANFLQRRKSKFVVMSYPTVSVSPFKYLFAKDTSWRFKLFNDSLNFNFSPNIELADKFKNILFISNENLAEFVNTKNYSEYFVDNFCKSFNCKFGHATTLTNEIIAENILKQIEAELDLLPK